MRIRFNYSWILLAALLAFITWYFVSKENEKPLRHLSYYSAKGTVKHQDSARHRIAAFTFTDQSGKPVSERDVTGKIFVSEFFFTTCPTICPVMNNNLKHVYERYRGHSDVLFLSHTVDPETDSVEVLKAYAESKGADPSQWKFLTGGKKELYHMARRSYLLDDGTGNGDEEDFVHTQNAALVDRKGYIRGFYDLTDSLDTERLIVEINVLVKE